MTSLRVAIDGTPLTVKTGGVRRYTAELLQALRQCFPDDCYALVSDQLNRPTSAIHRRWWLWGLRREMERMRADLFHGTDFAVPYLPSRPSVVTVHDLSPWRKETAAAASRRVRRRTPLLLRLGLATFVITPSAAVRREVIEYFRLPASRVIAVPLAASGIFQPTVMHLPRSPYFLYVGTIEKRKNVELLTRCWREIRKTVDVELLIVGRMKDAVNLEGATVLGVLPDEDLPALYSGALATLYPSSYEGFGLPVLEAMQCGAMVITSKDPAITEVAGGAAVQVDIHDESGWVEAMRSALTEPNRAAWRDRGLRRAAGFSWQQTAKLTREVYVEALRGR